MHACMHMLTAWRPADDVLRACAQWSVVLKLYCLVSETNAAATLFLSAFFWGFVAKKVGFQITLFYMYAGAR